MPETATAPDAGPLLLDERGRRALWRALERAIEAYVEGVGDVPVAPRLDRASVRAGLAGLDFERPLPAEEALRLATDGLWRHQVHTPHPRYFGLFNPAPTTAGIAADVLVAAFNPQLAAWSHNPFAAEVEDHLVRALGARFGYDAGSVEGTFCSGGAEANHTALLTALADRFPAFAEEGLRALPAPPALYVSADAHHSFLKAARLSGLGTRAVRSVAVDARLRLDARALAEQIGRDRASGHAPFLVVATAGTTGSGAVDPLPEIAEIAAREDLWLHADAAWGGAAALVPELRPLLAGIERADSITFDAHKWLSVPMGAGLFLTRHAGILRRTFAVATGYMPRDAAGLEVSDPYAKSMQWSRRFIGLKVFLSLAVAGFGGYAAALRHMTRMGERLRDGLRARGFAVVNDTPLPLVCCVDGRAADGRSRAGVERTVRAVVASGRAWVSSVALGDGTCAIRACITNYRTGPEDVDALVEALDAARSAGSA